MLFLLPETQFTGFLNRLFCRDEICLQKCYQSNYIKGIVFIFESYNLKNENLKFYTGFSNFIPV